MEISFLLCILWVLAGGVGAGVKGAAIVGNEMIVMGRETAPERAVARTTATVDENTALLDWGWGGGKNKNGITPLAEVTGSTPSTSTPYQTPPLNPAPELRVRARAYNQPPKAHLVPRATTSPTISTAGLAPTEAEEDTTITPFPNASDDPALADEQKWHVETFYSCVTFDVMTHCGWHEPVVPGGDEVAGAGRVEVGFSWGSGKSGFGRRIGIGSLGAGVLGVALVVAGLLV